MQHDKWLTLKERWRIRARIAEARSMTAWLRAGRSHPELVRVRKARLNVLAEKCGMSRPYPDLDDAPRDE